METKSENNNNVTNEVELAATINNNGVESARSQSPSDSEDGTKNSAYKEHVKQSTGNDLDYVVFDIDSVDDDTYEQLASKATKIKMNARIIRVLLIQYYC